MRNITAWRGVLAAIVLFGSTLAPAQPLLMAKPEDVGLSSERLARMGDWLRSEVAAQKLPGAVVLVARNGRIAYYETIGRQDPARPDAMGRDTIFRIYSMTKPLVSAAALQMVEEGRLMLDAPVARYIPAFANMKVGVEKTDAAGVKTLELVPANRPMTVQDLMRHTSGLTYGIFGASLVKKAYQDAGVGRSADVTNAEFAEAIAKMPLMFQPGTTWEYSHATDVLGRVLEVVEGKPLMAILKARLFDPLGMKDTSFYVTDPARQARIAEPLADDRQIGVGANMADPRVAQKYESGGGGLTSTADDYARFLQMMLNRGTLDGKRYLGPRTVEYMTSDHLGSIPQPGPGYGFGLGFAVRKADGEAPFMASAGEYNWGGVGGTYFWVDPKSNLFVILMMQSPKQRLPYRSILRNMVYAAVEK